MHRQIRSEGKWAVGKREEKRGCVWKGNGRVRREERGEGCGGVRGMGEWEGRREEKDV